MIDAGKCAVVHHQWRPTHAITTQLFGWLKQKAHVAFERATGKFSFEQVCHPQQNSRMSVMTTGVHATGGL
jgi:hypothetical protein